MVHYTKNTLRFGSRVGRLGIMVLKYVDSGTGDLLFHLFGAFGDLYIYIYMDLYIVITCWNPLFGAGGWLRPAPVPPPRGTRKVGMSSTSCVC